MATILVVDDDAAFIQRATDILTAQGHRVLSAADGSRALALMDHDRPDLVVLDVRMSYVVGGLDVTEAMAQEAALKEIPIMMVSVLPDPDAPDAPRRSKCLTPEERVAHPENPEAILQRISEFLR
jgi:two-component system, HptB-dependent secretion and biofilm response regulator